MPPPPRWTLPPLVRATLDAMGDAPERPRFEAWYADPLREAWDRCHATTDPIAAILEHEVEPRLTPRLAAAVHALAALEAELDADPGDEDRAPSGSSHAVHELRLPTPPSLDGRPADAAPRPRAAPPDAAHPTNTPETNALTPAAPGARIRTSLFGSGLVPVGLLPTSRAALLRRMAVSDSAHRELDLRLSGGILHELCHGPDRPWAAGGASWMLLEACAAWTALRIFPAHVFADRAGAAVPGLATFLPLAVVIARHLGDRAVHRAGLRGASVDLGLPPRLGVAMQIAEWQQLAPDPPFAPDGRPILAWARLADLALTGALDALVPEHAVDLSAARRLPDLLALAEATPWSASPSWHAAPAPADAADLRVALAAMWRVTRARPEAEDAPDPPPGGELRIDLHHATIATAPRADGIWSEPARWLLPPAWCGAVVRRGARRIRLDRLPGSPHPDPAALANLAARLYRLCSADRLEEDLVLLPDATPSVHVDLTRRLRCADRFVTLGSCFADEIGARLDALGVHVTAQPFGKLYDPAAVASGLELLAAGGPLPASALVFDRGRWHSRLHHVSRSAFDADALRDDADRRLAQAREALRAGATLLLTWGTAWVHTERESGFDVANNHHRDPSLFTRRRLTVDAIVDRTAAVIERLGAPVVLTVSPVRHLREGAAENQRSKAVLLLAAEALAARCPLVQLFPAYEIVLDELRDWRWFHPDGVHPTPAAVDVVFDRLLDGAFAPDDAAELRRRAALLRRLHHLPDDPFDRRDALRDLLAAADAPPAVDAPPATALRHAIELLWAALPPEVQRSAAPTWPTTEADAGATPAARASPPRIAAPAPATTPARPAASQGRPAPAEARHVPASGAGAPTTQGARQGPSSAVHAPSGDDGAHGTPRGRQGPSSALHAPSGDDASPEGRQTPSSALHATSAATSPSAPQTPSGALHATSAAASPSAHQTPSSALHATSADDASLAGRPTPSSALNAPPAAGSPSARQTPSSALHAPSAAGSPSARQTLSSAPLAPSAAHPAPPASPQAPPTDAPTAPTSAPPQAAPEPGTSPNLTVARHAPEPPHPPRPPPAPAPVDADAVTTAVDAEAHDADAWLDALLACLPEPGAALPAPLRARLAVRAADLVEAMSDPTPLGELILRGLVHRPDDAPTPPSVHTLWVRGVRQGWCDPADPRWWALPADDRAAFAPEVEALLLPAKGPRARALRALREVCLTPA